MASWSSRDEVGEELLLLYRGEDQCFCQRDMQEGYHHHTAMRICPRLSKNLSIAVG